MPFIPMAGGAKATIHYALDNQICLNTLWFWNPSGGPTQIEVQDLASVIDIWVGTNILPLVNEGLAYGFTTVRGWDTPAGFEATANSNSGLGAVTGEAAPNNVAPCVSFRTGMAGRSFRGRNYVPGISNSDVLGNTIDTAWANGIDLAYLQLVATGGSDPAPFVWVVASFRAGGADRLAGLPTPITNAIFTDSIVDSQRRRLPGRGK